MFYIGSTSNYFSSRWGQHTRNLKSGIHHNYHLQGLWNKYHNIEFRILEECTSSEGIYEKEQKWLDTIPSTQRINHGCVLPNPCLGTHHSEETRRRLSISHTNPSAEIRKHYSDSHKGKKQSEESKKKHGDALRGKKRPAYIGIKISLAKQNISQETRNKISLAKSGKLFSQEHKNALSVAQKKRFSKPEEREKSRLVAIAWNKKYHTKKEEL